MRDSTRATTYPRRRRPRDEFASQVIREPSRRRNELGMLEDAGLIGDFQARRGPALATVYRLYWRTLYAAAHAVLHDREDAEDCVHDVLVDVWVRERSYRPECGTLRAFLSVCVRNAALTRRRAALRHREIETSAYSEQSPSDIIDSIAISQLRSALLTLPPEQLRALQLAFFGGRTHAEIARELGLPLGTVKSRLSLAIKKLNVKLHDQTKNFSYASDPTAVLNRS
jgi:RNA polymerase sigma-70 factor (ECF subfamily)